MGPSGVGKTELAKTFGKCMTGNNIIRFSELDGLQGPLFNYQVAAALPPYLYFGGNNGFNKIDTRIQFDNSFIPWPSVLKIQKLPL